MTPEELEDAVTAALRRYWDGWLTRNDLQVQLIEITGALPANVGE